MKHYLQIVLFGWGHDMGFDNFLAYKALVEKQSRHQIHTLITYNGGEYVNNKFTTYCIARGIQMQNIVLDIP